MSWSPTSRTHDDHLLSIYSKSSPPEKKHYWDHATLVSKGLSSQPIICVYWDQYVSSETKTDSNIGVTHNGSGKTKTNAIIISTEANISLSPRLQDKSQLRIFGSRPPSLFLRASLSRPKADLTPLRPFVTWWSACSKSPKTIPNAPKVKKNPKNLPRCNSRPIFATVATAAGLTVLWFFHHHQLSYLTSRPKSESHKMICAKKKRCWLLSVILSWKTNSPWKLWFHRFPPQPHSFHQSPRLWTILVTKFSIINFVNFNINKWYKTSDIGAFFILAAPVWEVRRESVFSEIISVSGRM